MGPPQGRAHRRLGQRRRRAAGRADDAAPQHGSGPGRGSFGRRAGHPQLAGGRCDLKDGGLRRVPIGGIDLRRSLRAVWLGPKVPPSGTVRDFLSFVASQAATHRR